MMNKDNTTNEKKLKFKIINHNNRATLEKINNHTNQFINKNFVEIQNFHYQDLPLEDWKGSLKTLWVSDGSLDENVLLMKINDNNDYIDRFKNIKRNFKEEHPGVYRFKYGKTIKNIAKNFEIEVERYLSTIDDVIYNVEVDWNDIHNQDKELNLYNTTLRKVDSKSTTRSILIEKPVEYNSNDIKTNKEMVWNSTIVKKAKVNYADGFDTKSFDKYLNSISYNSVSNIANKTIEEAFSIKGIINALTNLWEVISTRKVSLLKTTLYGLINSLYSDSVNVQKIVNSLKKNLESYKTSPDTELLSDIVHSINVNAMLNELENEMNENKIILDVILRKYSITQHAAQALFIKEVKEAANLDNRLNEQRNRDEDIEFDKNDITEVKFSDALADYKHANRFRTSLYSATDAIIKEIKDAKVDETILNKYFLSINIEAGIIHDLAELDALVEMQFNKDKDTFIKQFTPTDDDNLNSLLAFVYEQLFYLKRSKTFNMIYENILLHLRNLLNLENEVEMLLKQTDQDFVACFNKWVNFKKSFLINNKVSEQKNVELDDLEINLTKNNKYPIKKQSTHEQPVKHQDVAKPTSKTKVVDENLVKLQNKFGKSGYKIQEIVNEISLKVGQGTPLSFNDVEQAIINAAPSVEKTPKVKGPKPIKLKNKFGRSGQRIEDMIKETKQELKKAEKKKR